MTKKKLSIYKEMREERLAKKGMKECPKCHFVQQYKGQKNPHFFDCPIEQERLREQKDLDDFADKESNTKGKNLAEKMSENWAED